MQTYTASADVCAKSRLDRPITARTGHRRLLDKGVRLTRVDHALRLHASVYDVLALAVVGSAKVLDTTNFMVPGGNAAIVLLFRVWPHQGR